MNPLLNSKDCILYDLKFRMITSAKFIQKDQDSVTLILFERPDDFFPERFRLVPEEFVRQGFPSYLCTLPPFFTKYHADDTNETYYIGDISAQNAPNQREDLRISVEIDAPAFFDDSEVPELVSIKNLSAGGMMFTSSQKFPKNAPFILQLDTKKTTLMLHARILSVRPASKEGFFAYGCQFMNMPMGTESALRSFIFTCELRSKR